MPPVARKTDPSTGHPPCWSVPQSPTSSAGTVKANSILVLRAGDGYSPHPHTCPPPHPPPHPGAVASGSGSVFAEGKPLARQGDSVTCGGSIASGSSNVFAG